MEKLVRRGGGGHFHGGGHSHSHGSGGSHHYGGEHSSGHSDGEGNGRSRKSSDDEQENSTSFWRSHGSHLGSSRQRNCESIVDTKERQACIDSSNNASNLEAFFIFCAIIVFIFLKIKDFGRKYEK